MEQADTRRGKPCWYLASDLVSNSGVALNDASFVETGIYQLLKMHFKDKPYYVDVLELFHDVSNVSKSINFAAHSQESLSQKECFLCYKTEVQIQIEVKKVCVLNVAVYLLALLLRSLKVRVSNVTFLALQDGAFCGIPQSPPAFLGY